jgi:hypothetical protein
LYFNLTFPIENQAGFSVSTNVKPYLQRDFLLNFLRTQVEKGAGPALVKKEVYRINLGLDLESDTYYVDSDTGGESLRDGILTALLSFLPGDLND